MFGGWGGGGEDFRVFCCCCCCCSTISDKQAKCNLVIFCVLLLSLFLCGEWQMRLLLLQLLFHYMCVSVRGFYCSVYLLCATHSTGVLYYFILFFLFWKKKETNLLHNFHKSAVFLAVWVSLILYSGWLFIVYNFSFRCCSFVVVVVVVADVVAMLLLRLYVWVCITLCVYLVLCNSQFYLIAHGTCTFSVRNNMMQYCEFSSLGFSMPKKQIVIFTSLFSLSMMIWMRLIVFFSTTIK